MELSEIGVIVEKCYNIEVHEIEKIKNVYKIRAADREYCLKVIKYELPHFLFILGAINHLKKRGFESIPQILKTHQGMDYIRLDNRHAYLTPWIDARESNYDNPLDIVTAAKKLAELHLKSRGFEVIPDMKPRVGWLRWVDTYRTRKNEILDFKRRIEEKSEKTEFDAIYLEHMKEELGRCEKSVQDLLESEYFGMMRSEMQEKGFCHHDYAHHNVLIEKSGGVYIIDFDYTILDTHLHDLSSLLIRRMKNGKWEINNAVHILDAYNSVYRITNADVPVMAAFMEFPQDYWQVGIQYYWEKQPWGEEFFLKKLARITDDSDEKQDFIDEFKIFQYKG